MRQRTWLLLILLLALGLRTGYVLRLPNRLDLSGYGDQGTFDQLATSLADRSVFGLNGIPDAIRSPAYPVFLAVCYSLLGKSYVAVRAIQAVLGVLTVLLIFLWARSWRGGKAARWAGGIAAVYPFYIFYAGYLLQETLLVFMGALVLYLLHCQAVVEVQRSRADRLSLSFASGAVLGMLLLTKASFLPFAGVVFLVLAARRKEVLATLLGFALCVLPWLARNTLLLGRPVWDTHGGITAFEGIVYYRFNKAGMGGTAIQASDFWPGVSQMGELDQDRFFKAQVREFILAHPRTYLKQVFWNFMDFWRLYPRQGIRFVHRTVFLTLISLMFEPLLILFSLLALWRWRGRWREWLLPVAFVACLTLVHSLVIAQMRYRLPVMGVLIVLSGGFLAGPFERQERKSREITE